LFKEYCEIVGLIVDETKRSHGIGKGLIKEAETWAKEKGIEEIVVRSNVKRERAHKFYLSTGYKIEKQSIIFRKET
jgi:GNAT superfamily N-acetyltransferase